MPPPYQRGGEGGPGSLITGLCIWLCLHIASISLAFHDRFMIFQCVSKVFSMAPFDVSRMMSLCLGALRREGREDHAHVVEAGRR